MSSLNKLLLIGNVGQVEAKSSASGKFATFAVATAERFKDRDGNWKEDTTWHDAVAYGPLADIVDQYVHKGSQVYVEGRIRKRNYTSREGASKVSVEVVAEKILLLGSRQKGNADSEALQF